MRKYILKRILISIVILFFVGFLIYALMRCLPTSYIENMARQKSMQPGSKSFEEWMAQLTTMYNMDKSIIPGYFAWLGNALRGQFGDSWFYTVPVLEKFNDCIWLSFAMGGIAFLLEVLIAIPLGIIAATKQYSRATTQFPSWRLPVSRCRPSSLPPCSSLYSRSSWAGLTCLALSGATTTSSAHGGSSWIKRTIWFCRSSHWSLSASVP